MAANLSHFLGVVLSSTVINITMLNNPELNKKLMVGENLQLEWKYNTSRMIHSERRLWIIALYLYNFTDSSKIMIVKRLNGTGVTKSSPYGFIPPKMFQRMDYNISMDYAKLLLRGTNFDDYGISFESLSMPDKLAFERFTEVLIVGKLISILLVIQTSFDLFLTSPIVFSYII